MLLSLAQREVGQGQLLPTEAYVDELPLVSRFFNSHVLEGHHGCVNSLSWNEKGTLLASASDDRNIIIRDVFGPVVHRIETGHMGNVFAVDFLPSCNDNVVISGAADHFVMMHDVVGQKDVWQTDARVKRLATAADEPNLFWSASEESVIREYDTRTNEVRNAIKLVRVSRNCKSLAVCPSRTHLVAVASTSTEVAIYDRRMNNNIPVIKLCNGGGRIAGYVTHVAFNKLGTECVVNEGAGSVLVFDITENGDPMVLENIRQAIVDETPIRGSTMSVDEMDQLHMALYEENQFSKAIDFINKLISCETDSRLISEYKTSRAACFLRRRWRNDSYSCLRDCVEALDGYPENEKALYRMIKALMALEQWNLAKDCMRVYALRFSGSPAIKRMEQQIANEMLEETTARAPFVRRVQRDYKERYCGSTNSQTDIKEANFMGSRDQFIVAGSDCGSLIIWSRKSGALVGVWRADENILNIVQPHPTSLMLATSGIEETVRIWQPGVTEEAGEVNGDRRVDDPWPYLEDRQADGARRVFQMIANSLSRMPHRTPNDCVTS